MLRVGPADELTDSVGRDPLAGLGFPGSISPRNANSLRAGYEEELRVHFHDVNFATVFRPPRHVGHENGATFRSAGLKTITILNKLLLTSRQIPYNMYKYPASELFSNYSLKISIILFKEMFTNYFKIYLSILR